MRSSMVVPIHRIASAMGTTIGTPRMGITLVDLVQAQHARRPIRRQLPRLRRVPTAGSWDERAYRSRLVGCGRRAR